MTAVSDATPASDAGFELGTTARWALAALAAGAGLIHVVMVPSHLETSTVEGWGFLVAAWLQLGLALAVALRPTRAVLGAGAALSVALIGTWLVSRTAGLPVGDHAGHPESVSLVDGACVALEAGFVVVAVAAMWSPAVARLRRPPLAFGAAAVAFVLASAAVASPSARDHAATSHGDHGAHEDESAAGDHPAGGHEEDDEHGDHEPATAGDDLGLSQLANGHQHEAGVEELDPETQAALSAQLAGTMDLVRRYPTVADAEAAGYFRAGPFSPGLGAHYTSPTYHPVSDGVVDEDDLPHPTLIYDGIEPESPIAGFMYMATGDAEPEGFIGPNDHWHYHTQVCLVNRPGGGIDTPFGADNEGVTEEMCAEVGGNLLDFTGYMVHVWTVPGYESSQGTFSEINPMLTCPDGTYHRHDIADIGERTNLCLSA